MFLSYFLGETETKIFLFSLFRAGGPKTPFLAHGQGHNPRESLGHPAIIWTQVKLQPSQ